MRFPLYVSGNNKLDVFFGVDGALPLCMDVVEVMVVRGRGRGRR